MRRAYGFTIVELLIVAVVIAVIATITMVSYNGMAAKSRDSQRKNDVAVIAKGLELYYADHGRYPSAGGSTTINSGWSTTADSSWANFVSVLKPYVPVPVDPISTPGLDPRLSNDSYNYAYFINTTGTYCGVGNGQVYLLVYKLESTAQVDSFTGDCNTNVLRYGAASNFRVSK